MGGKGEGLAGGQMGKVKIDFFVVCNLAAVVFDHVVVIDALEMDFAIWVHGKAAEVATECFEEGRAATSRAPQHEQQLTTFEQTIKAVEDAAWL